MSRKSFKGYWEKHSRAVRFRWEFIRRHKDFVHEWNDLQSLHQKLTKVPPPNNNINAKKHFRLLSDVYVAAEKMAEKWGLPRSINYPSPKKDYLSFTPLEIRQMHSPSTYPSWLDVVHSAMGYYENKGNVRFLPGSGIDASMRYFTLKIDLDCSKEKIIEELKLIVKNLKGMRKHKGLEKDSKAHLDLKEATAKYYDEILQVYDLVGNLKKKNQSWEWEQIGKRVYPEQAEGIKHQGNEFLIQKTKRAYETCEEMINGGYSKL